MYKVVSDRFASHQRKVKLCRKRIALTGAQREYITAI